MTNHETCSLSHRIPDRLQSYVRAGLLFLFLFLAALLYFLSTRTDAAGTGFTVNAVMEFLSMAFLTAAIYELVSLMIEVVIRLRGGAVGEVKMLTNFVRVLAVLAVMVAFFNAAGYWARLSAMVGAFAGLLLGWSLQAPVSGMAAYVLVTIKRPFRVGDRVLFPSLGLVGDVVEVGLMYTTLNQVGGAIGSEDAIGRSILIPNAMLFSQVAINYTAQQKAAFFLDEVVIRLTYDSNWDTAERILLAGAPMMSGVMSTCAARPNRIACHV